MSSNYPPGVTQSKIPGFRPQDEEAERYIDDLSWEEMHDWILDKELDAEGCVVTEHDEGGFTLEVEIDEVLVDWPHEIVNASGGRQWAEMRFDTADEAISYSLAVHDDEIAEGMVQEHLEEEPPDYGEPPDAYAY